MKRACLIVHGKDQDDGRFRPTAATPDMHWAYQLLDSFSEYAANQQVTKYPEGIGIHWGSDGEEDISVRVTSALWKSNEACFEHLMNFIKQYDLTYEFPCAMQECTRCEGHPSCISNQHSLKIARDDESLVEKSSQAA